MSDGHGGSVQDRGQHVSDGAAQNNGQPTVTRDPKLGREAVPAGKPGGRYQYHHAKGRKVNGEHPAPDAGHVGA